jgi:hypothetical protein
VRRLEELIEHGYVERVGNAYRVTDKVNIPELQKKLQRRIDMVAETAKKLAEVGGSGRFGLGDPIFVFAFRRIAHSQRPAAIRLLCVLDEAATCLQ